MQKGEQSIATEGTISSFLSKLSQNQKQTFINKIKDYIKAVRAWIKNVLSQYKDTASADAKALRQMDEAYAKVEKLWADMMEKATRTNNALENAKEAGEDLSGVESKGGKQYSIQLTEEEKHKRLATIRNNMSMRVDGDKLDNAIDFVDTVLSTGGIVDDYGFVTAWHRTNNASATSIRNSKIIRTKEDSFFVSTRKEGQNVGYGNVAIKMNIPAELAIIDDQFDKEVHFRVETGKDRTMNVEAFLASPYDYAHVIWMGDKGKIQLARVLDATQVPKLSNVKYDKMTAVWNVIEQTQHKTGEKKGTFHNKYEDVDIVIDRHSFEHSGNHAENILLISSTKELVENAIKVNQLNQNRGRRISDVYLAVGIDDSGNEYVVRLTVEHASSGQRLTGYDYLYAIYSKEGGQRKLNTTIVSPQSALPHHPPVVNIADLLEEVKDSPEFRSSMSKNVLAHFGIERNENPYTSRMLYSLSGLPSLQQDRDEDTYDLVGENERLKQENERLAKDRDNLKKLLALDKTLTHGRVLKEGVARKAAKGIIEKSEINYDVDKLTDEMKKAV